MGMDGKSSTLTCPQSWAALVLRIPSLNPSPRYPQAEKRYTHRAESIWETWGRASETEAIDGTHRDVDPDHVT